MKWINKMNLASNGSAIVNRLLEESWDGDRYIGADYDGLKKTGYRIDFIEVLLNEQRHHCCYCLKQIDYTNITLEHVIPHKASTHEFSDYLTTSVLSNHVVHLSNFNRAQKEIPPPKYPHDIAYHNIIASCNSNAHCNHFRGSKFIAPLIFDPEVDKKVEYDSEGQIYSSEYDDSLFVLGLKSEDLRLYRKLWCSFANNAQNPASITEQDIEERIYDFIDDPDFDKFLGNFISEPSKKGTLLTFIWFYNYYK